MPILPPELRSDAHHITGVYCWRNLVNGKVYIGGAYKSFEGRFAEYRKRLPKGRCHNIHFQRAYDKYGKHSFKLTIIERCHPADVADRETWWIAHYDATSQDKGYNVCPTGGSRLGARHTEETRAKMSADRKGRKPTDEARARMSASGRGKVHSAEHNAKVSAAKMGYKHTEEAKAKMRCRVMSVEARAKLSVAKKGKKLSDAHRARISAGGRGKKLSDETRAKMSAAGRVAWVKRKVEQNERDVSVS